MVHKELIDMFQEDLNKAFTDIRFTKKDSGLIIDTICQTIIREVAAGNLIRLPGVGDFYSDIHAAHPGRNPRTGEPTIVPAKKLPKFKASTILKEAVSK